MWGWIVPKPQPAVEEKPAPELELLNTYAAEQWEEMGFNPLEAIGLILGGVSPSATREFCRKHGCDPRTAISILL